MLLPLRFDIDHIQEEAEAAIQEPKTMLFSYCFYEENAFTLGKKAETVKMDLSLRELRSLKVVHHDQAPLSMELLLLLGEPGVVHHEAGE